MSVIIQELREKTLTTLHDGSYLKSIQIQLERYVWDLYMEECDVDFWDSING